MVCFRLSALAKDIKSRVENKLLFLVGTRDIIAWASRRNGLCHRSSANSERRHLTTMNVVLYSSYKCLYCFSSRKEKTETTTLSFLSQYIYYQTIS